MKDVIRVIDGSAQPGDPFWRFVDAAKAESGETEIEFFGPISEYSWFDDEITPKTFKDELEKNGKGGPVTLKVNSPGGEVFAAAAIRNILRDYKGRVTADIIGLAASAATVVTSAADVVKMRDTAMFMIHDPSTIAWGTIEYMQHVVDVLRQVKETIISGYQAKTKLEREKLGQMMSDETWMTAQQAKEYGFVDEVISDAPKKDARIPKAMKAVFVNCLKDYGRIPAEVLQDLGEEEEVIADETPDSAGESADNDETAQTVDSNLTKEAAELRARIDLILRRKL